ncbi:hypothetical protein HPHPA16_0114 [Helicobacter pylori Hp A-16]|nr:hypothetical protein HPHPA16_0114 [Helicobacter pylori Hp A-16]
MKPPLFKETLEFLRNDDYRILLYSLKKIIFTNKSKEKIIFITNLRQSNLIF